MSQTLDLAQHLITCPSITPHDADCQTIIAQRLTAQGFSITHLPFGDVSNLWARHGTQSPLIVFAGHTDVVPPGPIEQWYSSPFKPEIRDGFLYGRGAADMKSGLAAMIVAAENFIRQYPNYPGSIAFLITSDEEGPSINGTAKVVEHLIERNEKIDWCIIGEATSDQCLGDTIKNGRRGSLSGKLTIHGKQGHIAYPQIATNPIHKAFPALLTLTETEWDKGNALFQPTSFQISNIHAGTGANNVIPGALEITFNFRFSPEVTVDQLKQRVQTILDQHQLHYQLAWTLGGNSFVTPIGELVSACQQAIFDIVKTTTTLSTIGGTSDGRFIATTGCQIVELGPCNNTIHQIDECVSVTDLENLTRIYQRILEYLFKW